MLLAYICLNVINARWSVIEQWQKCIGLPLANNTDIIKPAFFRINRKKQTFFYWRKSMWKI